MSSPVSYSLMAQNINMEDFNRLIEALNEKMLIGFAFTDLPPFTEHDEKAKQAYIDCHGPVNWSTWKEDMIEISRMFGSGSPARATIRTTTGTATSRTGRSKSVMQSSPTNSRWRSGGTRRCFD